MGQTIFRRGLIPEFLLRGLILHDDSTNWSLPESGCVSKDEVDSISTSLRATLRMNIQLTNE